MRTSVLELNYWIRSFNSGIEIQLVYADGSMTSVKQRPMQATRVNPSLLRGVKSFKCVSLLEYKRSKMLLRVIKNVPLQPREWK